MTDFGQDTYCVDSLVTGRLVSGTKLVAQRLYHALTTPRGSLRGSAEHYSWGEDLTALCGSPCDKTTQSAIRTKVNRAVAADNQIKAVAVDIVSSISSVGAGTFEVTVTATTADGPFTLVLAIGEVTVELIGIAA